MGAPGPTADRPARPAAEAGREVDLLVIGGGITGLSVAVHAARRGLRTRLVEAEGLGGVSTQRSGALVRTHYDDPSSAALALRGLELFERFEETYGGPSGFHATGFAYVPTPEERDSGALGRRIAMLRATGVETELLDEAGLRRIDPAIDVSDVGVVAHEPRSGYADPETTTRSLARAARDAGAVLSPHTAALALLTDDDGAIAGVRVEGPDGTTTVAAGAVALCSGAWSAGLAAGVGLELPIRPTAVKLAFVQRRVPAHLTVIDAPNGIYLRPDPAGSTLVGRRTWTDEPLPGPDAPLPEVDGAFLRESVERLALRLPSARGAATAGSRAGMLDMTPDGLPFVGPVPADAASGRPGVPGLWLCCGWSGTGFKTGPSVGDALAGWIATGVPDPALAGLALDRSPTAVEAGVRSPH
jgi:sarcosine oxidase subunit beta